jgi:hypothetical protein
MQGLLPSRKNRALSSAVPPMTILVSLPQQAALAGQHLLIGAR